MMREPRMEASYSSRATYRIFYTILSAARLLWSHIFCDDTISRKKCSTSIIEVFIFVFFSYLRLFPYK